MPTLRLAALCFASVLFGASLPSAWAQAPQTTSQTAPGAAGRTPPALPRTVPPPASTPAQTPAKPMAPAASAAAAPAAAAGRRVDINSATEAQLDSLPGIGPIRAKAIVAGRPYSDVADLTVKKVLTAGVLAGIRDRIALANINTSSAADLQRTLPGIGDVRAKAIVAGRPYAAPEDLVTKKVLTPGVMDGIKDLITY